MSNDKVTAALARLRAHHEAMTPPTWCEWSCEGSDSKGCEKYSVCRAVVRADGCPDFGADDSEHVCVATASGARSTEANHANAVGVAAMRNALPALLAVAEAALQLRLAVSAMVRSSDEPEFTRLVQAADDAECALFEKVAALAAATVEP